MRKLDLWDKVAIALVSLVAICVAIIVGVAQSATTPNSIVTAQTPTRGIVQFLQGTDNAGTYKTLYTAGTNGSKCNAIWMTNNDASATHLITIQIVNGGIKYGGTSLTTVSNAGFVSGTPSQSLLAPLVWTGLPLDSDQNPYVQLQSGDTLQATFATALTASDLINLVATCADF